MPLGSITYDTIISRIATYIKNNCANTDTTRYNNIDGCFKSYSKTYTFGSFGGSTVITLAASQIPNNASLTSDSIKDKIKSYVGTSDYPPSENISMRKFIGFYNVICNYFVHNVGFVTSPFSSKTYLIFKENGFSPDKTIEKMQADDLIYAKSVMKLDSSDTSQIIDGIMYILINRISLHSRTLQTKYNIAFNG